MELGYRALTRLLDGLAGSRHNVRLDLGPRCRGPLTIACEQPFRVNVGEHAKRPYEPLGKLAAPLILLVLVLRDSERLGGLPLFPALRDPGFFYPGREFSLELRVRI